MLAHLDTAKGVGSFRQQDGGHGSRNPLRSVKFVMHLKVALKKKLLVGIYIYIYCLQHYQIAGKP